MSQEQDMEALDAYMSATPAVTPQAVALKNAWRAWFDGLTFISRRESDNWDEARNRRNDFNRANAVTPAEKKQVEQTIKTGQTTEQSAGETDRRDSNGNLPTHPPDVIPLEYKIAVGVVLVFGLALLVKKI
jgi:hypothetical protein